MATRSTIGIVGGNKIYCHWDGYTENNGRILLEHYNTTEKVRELLSLGSLSILGERTTPTEGSGHSFESPEEGVCVAYHRDRGEELRTNWTSWEEYNYQWDGNRWKVRREGRRWVALTHKMCGIEG